MNVILSGYPASGTTTLAIQLVGRYPFTRIDAGDIVREAAEARGMTLFQFDQLLRENEELDRELDAEIRDRVAEHERVVLESCYSGHRISNIKLHVWITAPREQRIMRFAEREDVSFTKASDRISAIEESLRYRACEFYGINIEDAETYDAVINTGTSTVSESFNQLKNLLIKRNFTTGSRVA